MRLKRRLGAIGAVMASVAAVSVWSAGAASAHVTVNAVGATQGGYTVLTFKVPTESATASTTQLKVQLPTDHPIASVSVQPHAGWSYKVTTSKLATPITTDDGQLTDAVSEIDWTADSDGAIKPGEFDQFNVSAGPLPKVDSLTFKAIQTYSDGKEVDWTEVAAPGSKAEPEHPAPTLKLAASVGAPTTATGTSSASETEATVGVVLGAVGIALGAVALLLVLLRRRSTATLG